ncbi:MAG: hypothetical protein HQM08_28445 [Candidatus Riflebacteria bacterium]|nr:hypothetical protein [Candidatus Riflebacteria bacterium]
MPAHFKFEDDFVIKFGGTVDLQWFQKYDFERVIQAPELLPPLHPARIAIQAAITISNFLVWWDLRKVNILQAAQFEERRILWVIDMLQNYFAEIDRGEIKLDTIFYLERELAKYFLKSQETELLEIPSSLLLQFDRAAGFQGAVNSSLISVIESILPLDSLIPGVCEPLKLNYKPFNKMKLAENSWGEIEALWEKLGTIEKVSLILHPIGSESLPPEILRKANMTRKRASDFSPISQFSFELLWTKYLVAILKSQAETILVYRKNEINFENKPEVILLENKEVLEKV